MSVETKTIGELKDYRFFVPSYQRGYRWTKDEVTALLDDVNEFETKEGRQKYCLQPLIVKKVTDEEWEVVDGQQRLTTIYIFLKIAEEQTKRKPFVLEYETRKNSEIFLANLKPGGNIDNENIDYFHITTARGTINEWLNKQDDRYIAISELYAKFIKSVFFIWHEIPENSTPIEIFEKVNLGKIPLTNAELIKALLLNKENFQGTDVYKQQLEISLAWDRIEQGLRDESFWYFLNKKEQSGTRIDMLFEVLAECDYQDEWKKVADQKLASFLVFYTLYRNTKKSDVCEFVKRTWKEIEKLYAELRDWYSDLDKYHLIGYLVTTDMKISNLIKQTRSKRKSDVWQILLGLTKENSMKKAEVMDKNYLSKLEHGKNNEEIRKILLLFNIATLVNKSEQQHRFPFYLYKRDAWDIEHIHAKAEAEKDGEDADNSLENLTLLNSEINRAYKDSPFPTKRQEIITYDKDGKFIPLCTRNVFLKVYSKSVNNMDEWEEADKNNYISAMAETLQTFFSTHQLRNFRNE